MGESDLPGLGPSEPEPWRRAALWAGPLAAAAVFWALVARGSSREVAWTAAATVWCGVWWVLEPVPLAATSLIPFAVLPLGGVLSHKQVATAYGHHLVLLMLAGSMVSMAMERTGAHRHIALGIVRAVGGRGPRRLVLGFLLASAGLSMWMSNTATAVMLLPVALATIAAGDEDALAAPVLLAVAYGASIGGSVTPIGTPPNLIFAGHYEAATGGTTMAFSEWMALGVPIAALLLPLTAWWLGRGLQAGAPLRLPDVGRWQPQQRRVLVVFGLMALAWMTREGPAGGWARWIDHAGTIGDSTVAIAAALVLFVLPRGGGEPGRLLDWPTAARIPWGVFIMIGGGIALGMGFEASKLSQQLGQALMPLARLSPWLVVPLVCLVATFATEVTSNTAVANVAMPVLAAAATSAAVDPAWLMLPAVFGLNHAFMLPVATAPNAIMYGTGRVSTGRMAKEGLVLNLLAVAVISVVCLWSLG